MAAAVFALSNLSYVYAGTPFSSTIATVTTLKSYIIGVVAVIVAAIVVCIAVFKAKKSTKILVRGETIVAACIALILIVNSIVMGIEYSIINNMFGDKYYVSDETLADSETLTEDIAEEGMVLLKNDDNALPLTIGLPAYIEVDGPASLKNNFTGQSGTAFPSATMSATSVHRAGLRQYTPLKVSLVCC